MSNEQLRAQLENLHAELQQADAVDPEQRELLQTLADDIHEVLDKHDSQPDHYTSLGERLGDNVAQLEASHPRITTLMRGAIESLAYLGI